MNALGIDVTLNGTIPLEIPGAGVGPLGALAGLSQVIAGALDWGGVGNPLANLSFPLLDFGDMASGLSLGDVDLTGMLPTDILGNLGGLGDAFDWIINIPQMLIQMLMGAF